MYTRVYTTGLDSGPFPSLEHAPRLALNHVLRELGVAHRRRDVRMPEQLLEHREGPTVRDELEGVGVAAPVRVEVPNPGRAAHRSREATGVALGERHERADAG